MDYAYSTNGWRPLSAPPVPYDDESVGVDLTAGGYAIFPVGSTLNGVVAYLDSDATQYPYALDVTELTGPTTIIWVHDVPSLAKLAQELSNLKAMLGVV